MILQETTEYQRFNSFFSSNDLDNKYLEIDTL